MSNNEVEKYMPRPIPCFNGELVVLRPVNIDEDALFVFVPSAFSCT